MTGPFDLERFVDAQESVFADVLGELRRGRKETHWMWFVFPQIEGLGASPTARRFALRSLDEVRAYLDHPLLGPRLRLCCEILLELEGRSAEQIFGYPDVMKLRSSLTLFSQAAEDPGPFQALLDKYYGGEEDPRTLALLG